MEFKCYRCNQNIKNVKTHFRECKYGKEYFKPLLLFENNMYDKEENVSSPFLIKCDDCKEEFDYLSIIFLEACNHQICKKCLEKKFFCPLKDCNKPITEFQLQSIYSKEEYSIYLEKSFQNFISTENFVKCPNCSFVIERLEPKIRDEMSLEEICKEKYRFRCRNCFIDFCSNCNTSPYHENFHCSTYKVYKESKKCRFCENVINEEFCKEEECVIKQKNICKKILGCGHPCSGIENEEKCLKCLECSGEDQFCNICFIETLCQSPSIELKCGHIFHQNCIQKKLSMKWPGSRIVFGFLNCPLCNNFIEHPSLKSLIQPYLDLYEKIKSQSLQRIKDSKENVNLDYALSHFAFYQCYKCKEPYYGGMKRCDQNEGDGNQNFNDKDLICGKCSTNKFPKGKECKIHGNEYIAYKCRFCCNIATWFCWGTTRFCDECHQKQVKFSDFAEKKKMWSKRCIGESCPSGGEKFHPIHGEEFLIGCLLCIKFQEESKEKL